MTKLWIIAGVVMSASVCYAADHSAGNGAISSLKEPDPWSFNVMVYMWLPGVDGDFTAGRLNSSVDKNFVDIVDASHRFPLGFMGRGEVHYERLGLYVDGVWTDIDLKPQTGRLGFASVALKNRIGIMDYGVIYRLRGPPDLLNRKNGAVDSFGSFRLDLYAGGRTIWLKNTITPRLRPATTVSQSFTAPLIGGRLFVDLSPEWFVKIDGNAGGFGADTVDFTGGVLGSVGYRAYPFDIPLSVELGYKALLIEISDQAEKTNVTLNGPFVGITAYW